MACYFRLPEIQSHMDIDGHVRGFTDRRAWCHFMSVSPQWPCPRAIRLAPWRGDESPRAQKGRQCRVHLLADGTVQQCRGDGGLEGSVLRSGRRAPCGTVRQRRWREKREWELLVTHPHYSSLTDRPHVSTNHCVYAMYMLVTVLRFAVPAPTDEIARGEGGRREHQWPKFVALMDDTHSLQMVWYSHNPAPNSEPQPPGLHGLCARARARASASELSVPSYRF